MAQARRFDKKMCELVYGVHEGDTIRILNLIDDYIPEGLYNGREGKVEKIDDSGQLHGTWGGLAVIPGEDKFEVIKHEEVPGKLYMYMFHFGEKVVEIFAGNTETAKRIFEANYGADKTPQMNLVREATKEEYEELENTGAPSPKCMDKWHNKYARK